MGAHKQSSPQGYQNLYRVPRDLLFPPSPKSVVPAVKGRPEDKWNREREREAGSRDLSCPHVTNVVLECPTFAHLFYCDWTCRLPSGQNRPLDTPVLHWPLCKSSSKSSACSNPESNQDSYMAQLIVDYDNISRYQFFFNEFLNRCH